MISLDSNNIFRTVALAGTRVFNPDIPISQVTWKQKEIEEQETFCSYVLYFIIILILLGYIGFYLAKERIVPAEYMNGITLGLLSGMIIINLLWSSIKN